MHAECWWVDQTRSDMPQIYLNILSAEEVLESLQPLIEYQTKIILAKTDQSLNQLLDG